MKKTVSLPNKTTIRIVICDSQYFYMDGLARNLAESDPYEETKIQIVGTVRNDTELLKLLHETSVDFLLLCVNLRPTSAIETLKNMKAKGLHVKTILLAANNHPTFSKLYLKNGACVYMCKTVSLSSLLQTIQKVHDGYKQKRNRDNYKNEAELLLSEREIEVLVWTAKGFATKQITLKMKISHHTAKIHRKNIMEKTGCKNMSEAISQMLGGV